MKKLLEYAEAGDAVVVWRVDWLGRSLIAVLNTVNLLASLAEYEGGNSRGEFHFTVTDIEWTGNRPVRSNAQKWAFEALMNVKGKRRRRESPAVAVVSAQSQRPLKVPPVRSACLP